MKIINKSGFFQIYIIIFFLIFIHNIFGMFNAINSIYYKTFYDKQELNKELLKNVKKKNTENKIKYLIESGAEIDCRDRDLNTPLIIAINFYEIKNIEMLIALGANINLKNKDGDSPLFRAIFTGDLKLIDFLIISGAEINVKNKNGWTPLMRAVFDSKIEIIELLLNSRAIITLKNCNNNSVFNFLINQNGDLGKKLAIQKLLKNYLDKFNNLKINFFNAIREGNYLLLKELLKKISLGIYDKDGNNPLHYAARFNKLEMFKLILSIRLNLIAEVNNDNKNPVEVNPGILYYLK